MINDCLEWFLKKDRKNKGRLVRREEKKTIEFFKERKKRKLYETWLSKRPRRWKEKFYIICSLSSPSGGKRACTKPHRQLCSSDIVTSANTEHLIQPSAGESTRDVKIQSGQLLSSAGEQTRTKTPRQLMFEGTIPLVTYTTAEVKPESLLSFLSWSPGICKAPT